MRVWNSPPWNTILLDRPKILYPFSSQIAPYTVFAPSPTFSDPAGIGYLIKFSGRQADNDRHFGLDPMFQWNHIRIDGQHRVQGLFLDGVTGSNFTNLCVTNCLGRAMAFQRCKESTFYSLTVTNNSSIADEPLIDLDWSQPTLPETEVDGNNQINFSFCRFVTNNHLIYVNVDSPTFTSTCRYNKFISCQFHVPPPEPFLGMSPSSNFLSPSPNRILLKIGRRALGTVITYNNFKTRGNFGVYDDGKNTVKTYNTYHDTKPEDDES